jgi:hypothetical protein
MESLWKKTLPNRTRGSTRNEIRESGLAIVEGQTHSRYFMEATELRLRTPDLLYRLVFSWDVMIASDLRVR